MVISKLWPIFVNLGVESLRSTPTCFKKLMSPLQLVNMQKIEARTENSECRNSAKIWTLMAS